MTDEFFREEMLHDRPDTNVFQFKGLSHELEMMQPPPPQQQLQQQHQQPVSMVAPNNWANDFMQHQQVQQNPQQHEDFEKIFQQNQQPQNQPQQYRPMYNGKKT